ncbi:MAG: family transcriptional regulator, cyclic receptor protein [Betaproteobacteria bacterium]|nr:family transcriptional regulator, cyclic receptor protein [Betaproteobacteria bacterium]
MSNSFLDRLDGEARNLLLAVARPVSHKKGERLVRHGDPSRGAYVLREGAAEATVTLPGGEKLSVARFGAGGVFGEMALIERGTCTATVTATENLAGWFIERDDFRSLVAQRVPGALRVQHTLTLVLSDKLRQLNAKVLEVAAAEDKPARKSNGADPLAGVKRAKQASFDFKAFLPHLPIFEGFDATEIGEILAAANVLELPRGQKIFAAGQPSTACFIVVRGAVKIRAQHEKRERRMAILGPGQLLGYMSALEKGVHGSDAVVREDALLLEIPAKAFESLYFGSSPTSTKLQRVIQKSLLLSLGQTNRHLTRLISQAKLRGAEKEGVELEKAYSGQITAAALD